LLGGGTTSEKVELALKRLGLNYEVVDESFSTERATNFPSEGSLFIIGIGKEVFG